MSKFNFPLSKRAIVDNIRDPVVYQFNLARNLALLSDDTSVIRRFYQVEAPTYFQDQWVIMDNVNRFLAQYRPDNAFSYFGIIPMIVNSKVSLVSGNGFNVEIDGDDDELQEVLDTIKERGKFQDLFSAGVYWESGLGDFAYRLGVQHGEPVIDVIEPHHLEVVYERGQITSYIVKETAESDPDYELHEIHYTDENGYSCISYKFYTNGEYISEDDVFAIELCLYVFNMTYADISSVKLPIKGIATIVYKQNAGQNKLYKGQRGVADIQGLDRIEDSLTEAISGLMDAIRKGGVITYIDQDMIPQTPEGRNMRFDFFNKTIISPKGTGDNEGKGKLFQVVQGDIKWESYIEPIKTLISTAINKVGLSPTTIGVTGLESINSSAESQEAREKTSLRTRALALRGWVATLRALFNRYLQLMDYIDDRDILDYSDLIQISFDDYINPSTENITEVLSRQVEGGLKSKQTAISDLNPEYSEEDIQNELKQINGQIAQ